MRFCRASPSARRRTRTPSSPCPSRRWRHPFQPMPKAVRQFGFPNLEQIFVRFHEHFPSLVDQIIGKLLLIFWRSPRKQLVLGSHSAKPFLLSPPAIFPE